MDLNHYHSLERASCQLEHKTNLLFTFYYKLLQKATLLINFLNSLEGIRTPVPNLLNIRHFSNRSQPNYDLLSYQRNGLTRLGAYSTKNPDNRRGTRIPIVPLQIPSTIDCIRLPTCIKHSNMRKVILCNDCYWHLTALQETKHNI
jgi:hypothetical protein